MKGVWAVAQSTGSMRPPAVQSVEAVGGRGDLVPIELGPGRQQPVEREGGVDPPHHRELAQLAAGLLHPVQVVLEGRPLGVRLVGPVLHGDVVALEEVAGVGDELLVVGVRVGEHDVVHVLAVQLLGERLHPVEVHARGDELHAGLLHGGDDGADGPLEAREASARR